MKAEGCNELWKDIDMSVVFDRKCFIFEFTVIDGRKKRGR